MEEIKFKQIEEFDVIKNSKFYDSIKNFDIMKMTSEQKDEVKIFILSLTDEEQESIIIYILDNGYKYMSHNDDKNELAESFLSDERLLNIFDRLILKTPDYLD